MSKATVGAKKVNEAFCWESAERDLSGYMLKLHAEGKLDREIEKIWVRSELLRIAREK